MLIPKPLILFIDAYDSFSNNIISLLETTLDASVRTIKIDNPALASDAALHEELRHYAAVVCGPGPGHPEKGEDVGIMRRIWRLSDEELVPVLGICLGFQSLCLEFGGDVKRLKGPQHGMIRRITHIGESAGKEQQSIFAGVGDIKATLYQSLYADIGQDDIVGDMWESRKWNITGKCPQLLPLAWVESSPILVCCFFYYSTYLRLISHLLENQHC
jgi:para-aminobenzoate synthetase